MPGAIERKAFPKYKIKVITSIKQEEKIGLQLAHSKCVNYGGLRVGLSREDRKVNCFPSLKVQIILNLWEPDDKLWRTLVDAYLRPWLPSRLPSKQEMNLSSGIHPLSHGCVLQGKLLTIPATDGDSGLSISQPW